MKIGVAREIKNHENRVALTPAGVDRLLAAGHAVAVETGAGIGSGLPDELYAKAGAKIVADAKSLFSASDLVVMDLVGGLRRGDVHPGWQALASDREARRPC